MAGLVIQGGQPLNGSIDISGAKNAVLPLMAASLLGETSILKRVPRLADVEVMKHILRTLGADIAEIENGLRIDASAVNNTHAPYELVSQMRASMLVMGPLLARFGRASVALPGGCAIGARPIDLHLKGFDALGAKINFRHGLVELEAKKLNGASIYLDFPSVGATQNIMMAAALAEGTSIIENAATEPEIVDLAEFLNAAGARIYQAGTSVIQIDGVPALRDVEHHVIGDRIEAGTYLMAAAASGGSVHLRGINPQHLQAAIAKMGEMGCRFDLESDSVRLHRPQNLQAVHVTTLPYPGFPTDLQAQFMALLTLSEGSGVVTETIFENRFHHVEELVRMGAVIRLDGRSAFVQGTGKLSGTQVKASDLRGGAALVIAALAAEGASRIHNFWHLERGYENLLGKLKSLGAQAELTPEREEEQIASAVMTVQEQLRNGNGSNNGSDDIRNK